MKANNLVLLALLIAGGLLHPLGPLRAQGKLASSSLPPDSELDALFASQNWSALASALKTPANIDDLVRGANWLRPKVYEGAGGLTLALVYSNDLWTFGRSMKVEDPNKDLRLSSAMMSLYAYELIAIDGFKCEDQSAPIARLNNYIKGRSEAWVYLNALPVDRRTAIIDASLDLERKTASVRKNDDQICRGGMAEIRAGLERGKQQNAPKNPGEVGTTVNVAAPPDWTPSFLPSEKYLPLQDKARADMRERLIKFLE